MLLLPKRTLAQALTLNDPVMAVSSSKISNGFLSGTLGYWKMDEAISSGSRADATGNGWTATDQNGTIDNVNGIIGKAAHVHNPAAGLVISKSIDARPASSPFGISIWIQALTLPSFSAFICEFTTGAAGWILYHGSNNMTWETINSSGGTTLISPGNIFADSTWYHFVVGYDGSKIWAYQNAGTPVSASVADVSRNADNIVIGNYGTFNDSGDEYYDEVAYFNFMPSASQVNTLYNGGNGLPFSQY
jgi:Concanavalin A-like lectin/glucanases superfamily